MRRALAFTTMAGMALLLAACGSSGLGGILNQPQASSYPGSTNDIFGTVNYVDTRAQRIDVNVNDVNGPRTMTVNYDQRTVVTYRGQQGNPSQLERGDQVDIRLANNGNGQYVADTITVTQSISENGSTNPNGSTYPSNSLGRIVGTVNYVDAQAHLIQLTSSYVTGLRNASGNTFSVYYDSRTRVMYQGNSNYTPADLERGDQVDISAYDNGNGQYIADTITVTRNVRQ